MECDNLELPGRSWQPLFQHFKKSHAAKWSELASVADPIYWLPPEVVESLGESSPAAGKSRERRSLISDQDAEFETSFRRLCQSYSESVVGIWEGRPVVFDLLQPSPQVNSCAATWAEAQLATDEKLGVIPTQQFAGIDALLDRSRHTRLGYCGWLVCNSDYVSERNALRSEHAKLSDPPPFPMLLAAVGGQPLSRHSFPGATLTEASAPTKEFAESIAKFLLRWELSALVTWDLPLPQGRLEGVPLGTLSHLRGNESTADVDPIYSSKPSTASDRDRDRDRQAWEATARGPERGFPLVGISARQGQQSQHEQAFRIHLIELAAKQRYGRKHGLIARITNALAKTPEHVTRIRGMYRKSSDL